MYKKGVFEKKKKMGVCAKKKKGARGPQHKQKKGRGGSNFQRGVSLPPKSIAINDIICKPYVRTAIRAWYLCY